MSRRAPARAALALHLLLCCTALGCITLRAYPGPARPRVEIASINPSMNLIGTQILIESVDGAALNWIQDRAEVLAGTHVLSVRLVLHSGLERREHLAELRFTAKPGERYEVLGQLYANGSPRVWIADTEFNTVAEAEPQLPSVGAAGRPQTAR